MGLTRLLETLQTAWYEANLHLSPVRLSDSQVSAQNPGANLGHPAVWVAPAGPQPYCTLRPEPPPVGAGRDPCVSLEEIAEKGDILITDGVTDLLHGAMVALQQALGGGDP